MKTETKLWKLRQMQRAFKRLSVQLFDRPHDYRLRHKVGRQKSLLFEFVRKHKFDPKLVKAQLTQHEYAALVSEYT